MFELLLSSGGGPGHIFDFPFSEAVLTSKGTYAHTLVFAASAVYNKEIYVFGGYTSSTFAYKYNPATDVYTELATLPVGFHGASAVTGGDKIYILGGSSRAGPNDLIIYDVPTNSYTRQAVTGMPGMTYSQAAISGNKIYIPQPDNTTNCYILDLSTYTIRILNLASAGITATFDVGAVAHGEWIYCAGGRPARTTTAVSIKRFYRINVNTDAIEILPELPIAVITGAQIYASEHDIYIIGGNSANKVIGQSLAYAIDDEYWITYPAPSGVRYGAATGYIDNKFTLIGGWIANAVNLNDTVIYGKP